MMETIDRAWVETHSGKKFHLLNPQPDEICIEDIAHSLSMQCRFTGHTKFHYSVAQHSLHTSYLVPPQDAMCALLHDASEAFLSDLSRPLKYLTPVGAPYIAQEKVVQDAIMRKFGLPTVLPESVHKADTQMLFAEKRQLMNPAVSWEEKWGTSGEEANVVIKKYVPEEVEHMFLQRFQHLTLEANLILLRNAA